jgi:hypothetical protein
MIEFCGFEEQVGTEGILDEIGYNQLKDKENL